MSDRDDAMGFKPYTLHIKFYSPCVYTTPITLDAVIAWCIAKRKAADEQYLGFYQMPGSVPETEGLNQLNRVIKHVVGGYGVPVASYMQSDTEPIQFAESWKTRFESKFAHLCNFGGGRRRIDTASGFYRSYNMPLPAKSIDRCWFAFIGDGAAVLDLLQNEVVGICKKVGEGFGWLDQVELYEASWTWQQICRMRPFPKRFADGSDHDIGVSDQQQAVCGWKPPYWLRRNIEVCYVP
ncbi:MAG: hypothetical protein M0Z43_13625 [Acidithiobacillus sp.]|nr:hypothetical protein [Acidithiobacillus sp.]